MQNSLPECVDFLKQVEREARYEGVCAVSGLDRLQASLSSTEGEVAAKLKFSVRAGVPCLDGQVSAELEMECQRCLAPVNIQLQSSFRFGLITSEEETDQLPQEFEPLLVEEGEQSLIDIIEDELILSLPIVPRHDEDCSSMFTDRLSAVASDGTEEETYKPFAGLKDLMT